MNGCRRNSIPCRHRQRQKAQQPQHKKQTQPQAEPLQPLQIGFALWLAGVLFFALRTAVSVFRMKALLRRWEKEPSAEAKAFFAGNGRQNAAAAHGLPCAGKSYGGRFIPHNCLSAP